uniref:Uncharacterized protein n=1 Tax=Brassica campestris TaxID=3711 RepID=M4E6W9_BRACM
MTKSENSTTCSHFSFAKIQPSEDADADPDSYALEKFKLYETRALKSPNWLFGSRKPEESGSATKPGADDSEKGVTSSERVNDFCNLDWLSEPNDHEEDIFQRYISITSTNEANGVGMVVLSLMTKMKTAKFTDIMLGSCPAMEPFDNDHELQQNSAEVLRMNTVDVMDTEEEEEETEMEKALNEYAQIGSNLGIIQTQCKYFAGDPCWPSRWRVGDDNIPKVI